MNTLRSETRNGVRHLVLCRAAEYNTITPALRDELAAAIDAADADVDVRVVLLRAEGPAFCAGYGLDWSTSAESAQTVYSDAERRATPEARRVWDSVADLRMMSRFVDTYMKLWNAKKPVLAAVQGWCIGGGTDLVLCADLIVAAEDAVFGYPPARVWGTPTTAMWVYRMGLEQAKRYLLTGDEIPAPKAAEIGLILETVAPGRLEAHATALAERMARLPLSQLVMMKLLCNQTAENMGLQSSRMLGTLFDGIARHTQEGLDFVRRAQAVGFRQAVRERDDPFEDYGSRGRKEPPGHRSEPTSAGAPRGVPVTPSLRLAREDELEELVGIDDDAGTLYPEAGVRIELAPDSPFLAAERARWQRAVRLERVFVAVGGDQRTLGFAALDVLDGEPYLEQLSVRRHAMRRGIGRQLLRRARVWAAQQPGDFLWLTTYDHVPWNRVFYEREGFVVVPEPAWPADIARHVAEQRAFLPDPERRIAMRCRLER
ncbi:crotonase/enoyl-CoA hydratase family protein [Myxococcota bacterium]|nr:crotonase/enoyl-CoA hydratase family protein [Myxococcota bacterium]